MRGSCKAQGSCEASSKAGIVNVIASLLLGEIINKIHYYITVNTIISSGFMEDNPNGQLSKLKMMEMYNGVLSVSKATKFVEEIFIKFDRDNNGHIDFKVVEHIQYDTITIYAMHDKAGIVLAN